MSWPVLTIAQASGKFDARRGPLKWWLEEWKPVFCGHTEVNNWNKVHEINDAGRDSIWNPHGRGDNEGNTLVSALSDSGWVRIHHEYFLCTRLTYNRVGGAEVEIWASIDVYQHQETGGRKLVFSSIHLPPTVEQTWFKKPGQRSKRVLVHRNAVRNWKRRCRRLSKRYAAERVLTGDFNLNSRRKAVRGWMRRTFPRLAGAQRRQARIQRKQGTHGPRRIDHILLSKGLVAVPGTYKVHPTIPGGYDHRFITVDIAWKIRGKSRHV